MPTDDEIRTLLYRVMLRLHSRFTPPGFFAVRRDAVEAAGLDVADADRWVRENGGEIAYMSELDQFYVLPV
jgi:hypothetical protein